MRNEIENYDTFITNPGSLDDRIQKATGLSGKTKLLQVMEAKPKHLAVDILLENKCNQDCVPCYFKEQDQEPVQVQSETLTDIGRMIDSLMTEDPDLFMFYPREITMAKNLLSLYNRPGMNRVITNAKLLHEDGMIGALKRAGIKRIDITIPGGREAYAFYTNEPAGIYDQLLSNVSLAVNSGFEVSILMPIYKQNIEDIPVTIDDLAIKGVRDIQLLRVIPVGEGKNMPDETFLTSDDILKSLRYINSARHKIGNKTHLALFSGYFGPNFYTKSIFQYLAGQRQCWPKSKYFCPVVNQDYVAVSVASKDLYACFFGLSIPEFKIGKYEEGQLKIEASLVEAEWLSENLRGSCSSKSCEEQLICMGGCRAIPFAWAKRSGEKDPLAAGQDFCLTRFLAEIQKQ